MKRDKNGRFSRDDGYNITFYIPSMKNLIYWAFIIIILLPWMVIGARFNILQKIFEFFEDILLKNDENGETTKKSGLFY